MKMKIRTAKFEGEEITIEEALIAKARSMSNKSGEPDIRCDKCDWPLEVRPKRSHRNGTTTRAYFKHRPGCPPCSYILRRTGRNFIRIRQLQRLTSALWGLYQEAGRFVWYYGEAIHKIEDEPKLWGRRVAALVERLDVKQVHPPSPEQLLARQGAVLRQCVFQALASLIKDGKALPASRVEEELGKLLTVIQELLLLIEFAKAAHPEKFDPLLRPILFNKFVAGPPIGDRLVRSAQILQESTGFYSDLSLQIPHVMIGAGEIHVLRELLESLTDANERIGALEESVEILKKNVYPARQQYDTAFFAEQLEISTEMISRRMREYEAKTEYQFEEGESHRKYTFFRWVAMDFELYCRSQKKGTSKKNFKWVKNNLSSWLQARIVRTSALG